MTSAVQSLLDGIEKLSAEERHELMMEVLRRAASPDELPEEMLVLAADELFQELDTKEAVDGKN